MTRIRVQITFEVDEPDGVLAKWPLQVVCAGINTLIDDGVLSAPVGVWNERVDMSIVSPRTLARRKRGDGHV